MDKNSLMFLHYLENGICLLIDAGAYPDIDWGIRLYRGNVDREGPVLMLPYSTTFLPHRYLAENSGRRAARGPAF